MLNNEKWGELSIWQEALKVKCQGLASLIPLGGGSKEMLPLRYTTLMSLFISCISELTSQRSKQKMPHRLRRGSISLRRARDSNPRNL